MPLHHGPSGLVGIDVDELVLHPLLTEERLGPLAVRTPRGPVHHDRHVAECGRSADHIPYETRADPPDADRLTGSARRANIEPDIATNRAHHRPSLGFSWDLSGISLGTVSTRPPAG